MLVRNMTQTRLHKRSGTSATQQPLLIAFDCETTGFGIYSEDIIEIAAEVVHCPVPCSNLTYESLVKTSRQIPKEGIRDHSSNLYIIGMGLLKKQIACT